MSEPKSRELYVAELQSEVSTLRARVAALEKMVDALEVRTAAAQGHAGAVEQRATKAEVERDMLKTTAKWSVPLGTAEASLKNIIEKLLWDLSMPTEYIEGKRDEALAAFRKATTP